MRQSMQASPRLRAASFFSLFVAACLVSGYDVRHPAASGRISIEPTADGELQHQSYDDSELATGDVTKSGHVLVRRERKESTDISLPASLATVLSPADDDFSDLNELLASVHAKLQEALHAQNGSEPPAMNIDDLTAVVTAVRRKLVDHSASNASGGISVQHVIPSHNVPDVASHGGESLSGLDSTRESSATTLSKVWNETGVASSPRPPVSVARIVSSDQVRTASTTAALPRQGLSLSPTYESTAVQALSNVTSVGPPLNLKDSKNSLDRVDAVKKSALPEAAEEAVEQDVLDSDYDSDSGDMYEGEGDETRGTISAQMVVSAPLPLPKAVHNESWQAMPDVDILFVGEGMGSLAYDRAPTNSRKLNRELRRRLEVQDGTTLMLLAIFFAVTVLLSALSLYQVAHDPSPVKFYSDPSLYRQRMTCVEANRESFLRAFNCQPQKAHLRLVGRRQQEPSICTLLRYGEVFSIVRQLVWRFRAHCFCSFLRRAPATIAFDVSLDVTPFIAGNGTLCEEKDATILHEYLLSSNPLDIFVVRKCVEWPRWEDAATNIKQHLRTLGFDGTVDVFLEAGEEVVVYRNHPWQNFVRSRVTHALVAVSIFGGLLWAPYIWLKSRKLAVATKFTVGIDVERYWELILPGLHPDVGFVRS